ncbi:MAG: anthranilate synthase component I [Deltaproteobacteria bacterium]|nr:anthranilate synthase component I [Deltaproteobacteria bacterium]MCL5791862.1 anthranilate synthase component I [Deltaproteobacteria bacterium]
MESNHIYPSYEDFLKLAEHANLIPVYTEILSDVETPVSVLLKLKHLNYPFLLESVEGGEKWARYSFIGFEPSVMFRIKNRDVFITENGKTKIHHDVPDPLGLLKTELKRYNPAIIKGLPRFVGGAVGYFGYDVVKTFEKVPALKKRSPDFDDVFLLFTDKLVIFDNLRHTMIVLSNAFIQKGNTKSAYDTAAASVKRVISILNRPLQAAKKRKINKIKPFGSNMTQQEYERMVIEGKSRIMEGDIIQVVLSQRFFSPSKIDLVSFYRALRLINPSPYMFYFDLGDKYLIGSSPEVLVRFEGGWVTIRPIAGTRKRGKTREEDEALEKELLEDKKEKAEHVMLVDLARNDIGRIAKTGSVRVDELMIVERYSHVMHIVSEVRGAALDDKDAVDILKATFPAGTLSGAPKVKAMEIIEHLEKDNRGPYGGAVGYISYTGSMDTCIAIRTAFVDKKGVYIQSGAGIVYDSQPENEYSETRSKAQALMDALKKSGEIK